MKNNILVTGGTGFIGSHLVDALIAKGYRVKCLVYKDNDITYLKNIGVKIVYGDLLDKDSLLKAIDGVDVVYHLAAMVRPYKSFYGLNELSNLYRKANFFGTKNLAEICLLKGIQKFIYYSSIAAVGLGCGVIEDQKTNPISDYGKSKLESENFLLELYKTRSFPVVIIRPGKVYGSRNIAMLSFFNFISKGFIPLFGRGENIVPWCYVENLIRATILAEEKGRLGERYFIFDAHYTISDFAQHVARKMNVRLNKIVIPLGVLYAAAYLKHGIEKILRLDICPLCLDLNIAMISAARGDLICSDTKAREELGYLPFFDLDEGLTRTIDWYKTSYS